jgi:hypothetical protein
MFAIKPAGSTIALVLASLCTLSACGGSDKPSQSLPLPVASDPAPPTSPTPPTPPTTPPTTPPPPTTPGPVQITLAPTATPISAAVSYSTDWWSDWNWTGSDDIQGVACQSGAQYHAHALISFYKDGQRLALPANIGRNSNCDYELQTLDKSGLVHIESSTAKVFTLGQFFAVWGQSLSASMVAGLAGTPAFYIIDNGTITQFTGDPQTMTLDAHREILIVTGTPPTQVPRYDWANSGL